MANSIGGMIENLTTGSLVNRGTLLNRAGGTIENSGVIDNEGTLQNLGTLQNKLFGTLNNVIGALDNLSGSLLLNETGASVVNGGSFENAGTTQNLGNFLNQVTGTMNNSIGGMIENLTTGSLVNRGTLLNQSGGTIENSGVIDNEGTLRNLGTLLNKANGVINNTTGAIENLGTLLINAQSSVNGGGTYSQSGGSTVVDGTLGASRIDILGGVLSGSGVLQGDVLIGPDGTLAPGNSPGTLQIDGDFHLDGGRLAIELAALTMHDVLDISGAAFLDGGFIDYLFSFTPSAGDSFVFLTTLGGIAGLNTLNFNFFGDLGGLRFATLLIDDSLVL
jgi:fibronectin-binding autotransporter adhesin